jgi:hypothetical protein
MRNDALKIARRSSLAPDIRIRRDDRAHGAIEALRHHDCNNWDTNWRDLMGRYLEGWAEANPIKILQATGSHYRLDDPLIGLFNRWSLPRYFELLQEMLSPAGPLTQSDLAFCLHGPLDQPAARNELQFWREAPRIGLTGVARITFGEHGVIGESVAYDLNLASGLLHRAF